MSYHVRPRAKYKKKVKDVSGVGLFKRSPQRDDGQHPGYNEGVCFLCRHSFDGPIMGVDGNDDDEETRATLDPLAKEAWGPKVLSTTPVRQGMGVPPECVFLKVDGRDVRPACFFFFWLICYNVTLQAPLCPWRIHARLSEAHRRALLWEDVKDDD